MQAASINDRNPLIKILNLGLLDRQVHRDTGPDGSLGYGLKGPDITALQRTCQSAHKYLKMTDQNEINHLMRVSQGLRRQPCTDAGLRNSRVFITRIVEKKCGFGPRGVYRTLAEMCTVGAKLCIYKSTPRERTITIAFAAIMHVQSGYLTHSPNVLEWIDFMRNVEASRYRKFLDDSFDLAKEEASLFAEGASVLALGCKAFGSVAHTAVYGAGWAKAAAVATMPIWPMAASCGAGLVIAGVPLAVGLAVKSHGLAAESLAHYQIDLYKDAVAFDLLMYPDFWLLHEHDERDRINFYDDRLPQYASVIGKVRLRQMYARYVNFINRP